MWNRATCPPWSVQPPCLLVEKSDCSGQTCNLEADVDLLNGLLDCFAEAFDDPQSYRSARPSRTYLQRLLGQPNFIALAAREGDRVFVGLAAYVLDKFVQERSEIYIYDLAVLEAHRRRGVVTALIERLRAIACKRGAYVVFVPADLSDGPAIALYTKLGAREDVLHFDIAP